jgi:phage portal protein BeeE
MGFWSRIFGASSRRLVPLVGGRSTFNVSPRRGVPAVLDAYRTVPWLRSVVDVVAGAVADTTWRVYLPAREGVSLTPLLSCARKEKRDKLVAEMVADRALVEVSNHLFLALWVSPNDELTGRSCVKLLQVHLDLAGEAFLHLIRSPAGQVLGYWPLPPHTVQMVPDGVNDRYYVFYAGQRSVVLPPDMVYLRHLDAYDPRGRGAGQGVALGDEVDSSEAISRMLKSYFQRGGKPDAIVGLEGAMEGAMPADEQAADLQKRLDASHGGPEQAGKLFVASGKMSWARFDSSFKDTELPKINAGLYDFIRHNYGVNPEVFGDMRSVNRAQSVEAKYNLAEYAILPRCEFWRTELQLRLLPLLGGRAFLDFDDPRPAEWERTFRVMAAQPSPAFTYNEQRALAGYAPLPELEGVRPPLLPGQPGQAPGEAASAAPAAPAVPARVPEVTEE